MFRRGTVDDANVKGVLEVVDSEHNVIDHLVEEAIRGGVGGGLHGAIKEQGEKEETKMKENMK